MNTRPASTLRVRFAGKWCAYVSGYGSRELLSELRGGKAPIWSATLKAWATTPRTAADVIAIAESRNRRVLVSNDEQGALEMPGDAS